MSKSPADKNPPPDTVSKTAGENWIQHVIRANGYSLAGLAEAFRHEMAFRIECFLAVILIPASFFLSVSIELKAILVASVLLVLITELLNSALEWVIDYISLEHHPYAKKVKDMGSAAVFIALVNVGLLWTLALLSAAKVL